MPDKEAGPSGEKESNFAGFEIPKKDTSGAEGKLTAALEFVKKFQPTPKNSDDEDELPSFFGPLRVVPTNLGEDDDNEFTGPQGTETERRVRDAAVVAVNDTLREYLTRLDRGVSLADQQEILNTVARINLQAGDILRVGKQIPGSTVVVPVGIDFKSNPQSFDGVLRARVAFLTVNADEGMPEEILNDKNPPSNPRVLRTGEVVLFDTKSQYPQGSPLPDKLAFACTQVNTPEGRPYEFDGIVFLINKVLEQLESTSGKVLLPIINSINPTEYLLALATAIVRRRSERRRINEFRREVSLKPDPLFDLDRLVLVDTSFNVLNIAQNELATALKDAIDSDRFVGPLSPEQEDDEQENFLPSRLKRSPNFPSDALFATNSSAPRKDDEEASPLNSTRLPTDAIVSTAQIRRKQNPPPELPAPEFQDVRRRPAPEPLVSQPLPDRVFIPRERRPSPFTPTSETVEERRRKEEQADFERDITNALERLDLYLEDENSPLRPEDLETILNILESTPIEAGDITKVYAASPPSQKPRGIVIPVSNRLNEVFRTGQSARSQVANAAFGVKASPPEEAIENEFESIGIPNVLSSGEVITLETKRLYGDRNPFPDLLVFACTTLPTPEGLAGGFASTVYLLDKITSELEDVCAELTYPLFNRDLTPAAFLLAFCAGALRSINRLDQKNLRDSIQNVQLMVSESEIVDLNRAKDALIAALNKKFNRV